MEGEACSETDMSWDVYTLSAGYRPITYIVEATIDHMTEDYIYIELFFNSQLHL